MRVADAWMDHSRCPRRHTSEWAFPRLMARHRKEISLHRAPEKRTARLQWMRQRKRPEWQHETSGMAQ
ncbi:hypothetical protein V1264_011063 [Littorina saxatilis]|uniref:Uncharacterized protein n=1 Tax=Littorina saxatilis TaxID=31220 RepID=A0AAN9BUJ7_9CAEN